MLSIKAISFQSNDGQLILRIIVEDLAYFSSSARLFKDYSWSYNHQETAVDFRISSVPRYQCERVLAILFLFYSNKFLGEDLWTESQRNLRRFDFEEFSAGTGNDYLLAPKPQTQTETETETETDSETKTEKESEDLSGRLNSNRIFAYKSASLNSKNNKNRELGSSSRNFYTF